MLIGIVALVVMLVLTGVLVYVLAGAGRAGAPEPPRAQQAAPPPVPAVASAPMAVAATAAEPMPEELPARIVIGRDAAQPVLEISTLVTPADFARARPVDDLQPGTLGRLAAMLQAVPAVMAGAEVSGKRIMEVVINGQLVQAADGNGMRAFAQAADGRIAGQARLFDANRLQTVVSAAALWQVASVLVAQKHLADISRKLDDIRDALNGIRRFQDNQRRARMTAACEYLEQVHATIRAGEFPPSMRFQLESCERDLLEIQTHLAGDYQGRVDERAKDTGTFGTEALVAGLGNKFSELDALAADIGLCLKARVLGWYMLSLLPGEQVLKDTRRQAILKSLDALARLADYSAGKLSAEIDAVDAMFTSAEKIARQRRELAAQQEAALSSLAGHREGSRAAVQQVERLVLEHNQPQHLLVEYEGDRLVGVRRAAQGARR